MMFLGALCASSACPGWQVFTLFWPLRGLKNGAHLTFSNKDNPMTTSNKGYGQVDSVDLAPTNGESSGIKKEIQPYSPIMSHGSVSGTSFIFGVSKIPQITQARLYFCCLVGTVAALGLDDIVRIPLLADLITQRLYIL